MPPGRSCGRFPASGKEREKPGVPMMDKDIPALQVLVTEMYYWITVVMMFLIHVGFCTYEVGVSRHKNHLQTLMKNAMVIPTVGVTFYLFGWWLYSSMVNGPGITGG